MKTNSEYKIADNSPQLQRGPNWLIELRRHAQSEFNEAALPQRGIHFWRYTDPEKFMVEIEQAHDSDFTESAERIADLERQHLNDGHLAALVSDLGGKEVKVETGPNGLPDGVVISSLSEATEKNLDLVQRHLYQLVNQKTGKFEAMNGSLWNDGLFIFIPDNVTIEQPIHALRMAGGPNSATFPRLLFVVGKNAEVTLIDEYVGGSDDRKEGFSFSNGVVEVVAAPDSRTRYLSLQQYESAMHSYLMHRAKIDRNAQMLTIPLIFGGELCKQSFGVELAGEGADSNMYGLLFGGGRQHFDNHTAHHHSSGKTTSDIDFKVVLKDKALSAYTGLIKIDNGARTCEAYQENRNLMLNEGTKAETIPELEILNQDVSCSHGATLGPIDEESIFYLKARGIRRPEAVRMIVGGFVQTTLKQVPEDLRERITEVVLKRLETI